MDTKPNFNPEQQPDTLPGWTSGTINDHNPTVFGLSDRVTNLVVHAGDRVFPVEGSDGQCEFRFTDQGGTHYATLHGHTDDTGHVVIDAIGYHGPRRGGMLPVRPNPLANTVTIKADPYTYVGDPPVFTATFSHFHRHPHTKPDDALTIDCWHAHDHTHPAGTGYGADHHHYLYHHGEDAAAHDPGLGHGHDERGDDTKPGYPGNPDPTPLTDLIVTHEHGHYHGDGDGHTTVHTHDHSHTGDEALSKFHGAGHGADIHRHTHPTRDG